MATIQLYDFQLKARRSVRAIQEGYTLFFNCRHLMLQLDSTERVFFDFLCEKMRLDNNTILINKLLKKEFIGHIAEIASKKKAPSLNSLNQYVSRFKALNLLIPLPGSQRIYYFINPRYAFKGSKTARNKYWKSLLRERSRRGLPLTGLVDTPE